MKKLIVLLLAAVMLLGMMAGCKQEMPKETEGETTAAPTVTEPDETDPIATDTADDGPAYQLTNLVLVEEAARFDGDITDVYTYGVGQIAYYAGETVYEKDTAAGWEDFWDEWQVGQQKSLCYFDGSVAVMENESGTLTAFRKVFDPDNHEGYVRGYTLDGVPAESFRYAMQPINEDGVWYVYQNGGVCYFGQVSGEGEANTYPLCLYAEKPEDAIPVVDFYPDEVGACVKLEGDTAYNTFGMNLTFDLDHENNLCYITVRDETAIAGIREVYVEAANYLWATRNGEEKYLYGYLVHDFDSQFAGLGYWDKPIEILLPEGYTASDIAAVSGSNQIYVLFDDGELYFSNTTSMKADEIPAGVSPLGHVTAMDACRNNIVKVYCQVSRVYVLMNDGYLYEVKA